MVNDFIPINNINQANQAPVLKKGKGPKLVIAVVLIILLVIVFFGGLAVGLSQQLNLAEIKEGDGTGRVLNSDELPSYLTKDVNFKLYWKVWEIIKEKYIDRDKITNAQLFYGSLAGILASLNDPYSVFLPPDESEKFNEELSGRFEGIGAEIGIKNERLTVISPLPDSPAAKAGLRPLDKILTIDGLETTGISLEKAVYSIRGERGTQVKLTIAREGESEPLEFIITRDRIQIKSVQLEMKKNNFAYLKISNFNSDTSESFRQKVNELLAKSPKGVILDLRNNPGGYLNTAVDIAGYWLAGEQVVVKEEFSDPGQNREHRSSGQAQLKDYLTVVLINQASASASEIVAGALQDYGVAKLIGQKTFGKGSVQELEKLSDGSSVKFTVARWLTPKGRNIDQDGIAPDEEIDLNKDDYDNNRDPQLDKAFELLTPE